MRPVKIEQDREKVVVTLTSTQKVVAISVSCLTVAGALFWNGVRVAQYVDRAAAFDSTASRRLETVENLGTLNRQMILLLGRANRYQISDPRRDKALDDLDRLDERARFNGRKP